MSSLFSQELLKQADLWVKDGLISEEQRIHILERYPVESHTDWSKNLVAIIGALLIGVGIISLVAYNWNEITKPLKIFLGFIPLIGSILFVGWTVLKSKTPLLETSIIALGLSIMIALAISSQVFQLQGNIKQFILLCLVLWAPALLLSRSLAGALFTAALVFILSLSFVFTSIESIYLDNTALFLFFASLLPFVVGLLRAFVDGKLDPALIWVGGLAFVFSNVLFFQDFFFRDGILVLTLLGMGSVFSLAGNIGKLKSREIWKGSMGHFSIMGGVLSLTILPFLTYADMWKSFISEPILQQYYTHSELWFLLFITVSLCSLFFGIIEILKRGEIKPFLFLSPIVCILMPLGSALKDWDINFTAITVIANLFTLALGVFWLLDKATRKFRVMGGSILILILLNLRFFEADFPLFIKGTAFLISGILFVLLYKLRFNTKRLKSNE